MIGRTYKVIVSIQQEDVDDKTPPFRTISIASWITPHPQWDVTTFIGTLRGDMMFNLDNLLEHLLDTLLFEESMETP